MTDGYRQKLVELGTEADENLPILQSLLLLSAAQRDKQIDLTPYEAHIVAMHDALTVLAGDNADDKPLLEFRLDCLNRVIRGEFKYHPDRSGYDEIENIDFIRVIDRRAGIPVALGAIYLELARRQGWKAVGLSFPGHFLIRLEDGADRRIVDPYYDGKFLDAPDLRKLVKQVMGANAELNANYYNPVMPRDVVLRFCNNRKTRLIQQEEYQKAFDLVLLEQMIAPNEPRLLFDAGMLCVRLDQIRQAIDYLSDFIARSKDKNTVAEAREIIRGLQIVLQ
jgi:regulator of sirC expression with transglutaminase-like and TPR domain